MTKPVQMTLKQAVAQAKKAIKKNDVARAVPLLQAILKQNPAHPFAKKALKKLEKRHPQGAESQVEKLIILYQSGQMAEAEKQAKALLTSSPDSLHIRNILGAALRGQGKLQEAVAAFDSVISLKPDFPDGYNNRGITRRDLGQFELALADYDKAIQLNPDYADAYSNRGVVLHDLGQLEAAVESYTRAIQLNPDYANAYSNLGATLSELEQFDNAITNFKKATQLNPGHAEAHYNLGVALKKTGQAEEALDSYQKAIELRPGYAEAFHNYGVALHELEQIDRAVEMFEKALALKPDYAEAYRNYGQVLSDLERHSAVVTLYERAIEAIPDDPEIYCQYGAALHADDRVAEALDSLSKAVQLNPDYAEAYNNRGVAHYDLGLFDKSADDFKTALDLRPDYENACNNYGNILKDSGRPEEAIRLYEKAIEILPEYAEAHRNLSTVKTYQPGDGQLDLMEQLMEHPDLWESQRIQLSFALAKAYEDLGEFDRSFDRLKTGNDLRRDELNYDIQKDRELFARLKEGFETRQPDPAPVSDLGVLPVFIVGMPRSGTTLTEQILSTHSRVYGAGELDTINHLVSPIPLEVLHPDGDGPAFQKGIDTIRAGYLRRLAEFRIPEKIITDKMPLNFRWIGFILFAFPDARIIHLNRDPIATCWSNYKHYFSKKGNSFAYDLSHLAEFYAIYQDLMAFWRNRFPDAIHDLCYEDLTVNTETEIRDLLSFCGLDWEEECLAFHRTERAVKTASSGQVRKAIYQGSSEAWQRYEAHLAPLVQAFSQISSQAE